MKPDGEWLELWEKSMDKLLCPAPFNDYFTRQKEGKAMDTIDMGPISVPHGRDRGRITLPPQ